MRPAPLAIGIPGGREVVTGTALTGYHLTNAELFNALLRHGSRGSVSLVAPSLLAPDSQDRGPIARPVRARKRATVEVFAPVGAPRRSRCSVWVDLSGPFKTLYNWRAVGLTQRAPFTFVSHGFHLSGPDSFRWLIDCDVRPWDSLVCSTESTRTAVQKLLDRVHQVVESTGSRRRFPFRLDVIPHGVDTDRFRPRAQAPVRKKLGLPLDALILLSIGRISPAWKGDLLPLLAVFRSLLRERPGLPLLLVVAGYVRDEERHYQALLESYAAELQLAPDQIRFVGPVSQEETHLWYAAADIFVGVTHFDGENFGRTVVEAMAAGIPQVVTSWGGFRDTVVDGVTGFQIPTLSAACDADLQPMLSLWREVEGWLVAGQAVGLDTRIFRQRLLSLIDSPALRARMAAASRARATALYNWKSVVLQYEELWREQLREARTAAPEATMMAEQTTAKTKRKTAPSRPDAASSRALSVFDRFGELSSHTLELDAWVQLAELGRLVLQNQVSVPIYLEMEAAFSVDSLGRLLSLLRGGTPARVDGLIRRAAGRDQSVSRAVRHLLFALKHGFVELCAADESPPRSPRTPTAAAVR